MRRLIVFAALGAVYAAFWAWYTGKRRPLTAEEVENYVQRMRVMGANDATIQRLQAFLQADTGREFVMVNLIRLRDTEAGSAPASETLDKYSAPFLRTLLPRASHPVMGGKVAAQAIETWGLDDASEWTMVGLVRYRSRRDMIEAATAPSFPGMHTFKTEAIEKTIAVPVDPWMGTGDPRLIGGLVAMIGALLAS